MNHQWGNKHRLGIPPWNKGKKTGPLSEDVKKKLSEAHKGNKNRVGTIPWNKGIKRTDVCGEKHPNWKGGKSEDKRSGTKYIQWRSNVYTRDNWTCQTCRKRGIYIEAHHIKSWAEYPKLRYDIENGVTLCRECHKLTDNYKGKNNGLQLNNGNQQDNKLDKEN